VTSHGADATAEGPPRHEGATDVTDTTSTPGTGDGAFRPGPARRAAVAAVVAVVALAAVGVAVAVRDDGPPVIELGAADGVTATSDAARTEMAGDALLAPAAIRFELADGARFPAGEADAWRLDPPEDLADAAARLGRVFGIDAAPSPSGVGDAAMTVGPTDGSAPTVWVGAEGDWSFHDPTVPPRIDCIADQPHGEPPDGDPIPVEPDEGIGDTADGVDAAEDTADGAGSDASEGTAGDGAEDRSMEGCVPVPAEGVPDEATGRAEAERIFAALDLPVTPRIVDVVGDEWATWVTALLPLGGRDTDLSVGVGFGPGGAVVNASGTVARPEQVGPYPTIDAEAAVARLQAQQGGLVARPLPLDGEVTGEAEAADDPAHDGPADDGPAVDEPVVEDVEAVVVTLVSAEPVATTWWDADGTRWILPGVRFLGEDGSEWLVVTVADEYLDTGDAGDGTDPEPVPMPEPEPEPVPGPDEPVPDPDAPVSSDDPHGGGGEPGTAPAGPGAEPGGDPDGPASPDQAAVKELVAQVVGLHERNAVALIEQAGFEARVVARDGEGLAITDDLRHDRINLEIDGGQVAGAYPG
jgi:hypothetical protein